MPELPEVETIRRTLEPLAGARILKAEVSDPRLTRPHDPVRFAAGLEGARFAEPGRRGKYLLLGLDNKRTLLIHLRMTGVLRLLEPGSPLPEPHLRAVLELDDGRRLAYTDVRRFGTWAVMCQATLDTYLGSRLGPEPLGDWPEGALGASLATQRRPLLSALLDQRTVAGIGTIYAMEALHTAGLDPRRRADTVDAASTARLQAALVDALREGLVHGGTSFRDYRRADGSRGGMQDRLRVYGRGGAACLACGTTLERAVIGGRGAVWCPDCQPGG